MNTWIYSIPLVIQSSDCFTAQDKFASISLLQIKHGWSVALLLLLDCSSQKPSPFAAQFGRSSLTILERPQFPAPMVACGCQDPQPEAHVHYRDVNHLLLLEDLVMVGLWCPSLMAADIIKLNGHEETLSGQISISRMCAMIVGLCLARLQFCVTSPGAGRQQFCNSRCSPALCLALNKDFSLWWPSRFSQVCCQQAPQVLIILQGN